MSDTKRNNLAYNTRRPSRCSSKPLRSERKGAQPIEPEADINPSTMTRGVASNAASFRPVDIVRVQSSALWYQAKERGSKVAKLPANEMQKRNEWESYKAWETKELSLYSLDGTERELSQAGDSRYHPVPSSNLILSPLNFNS